MCSLFAEESAKTQQEIEFGNKETTPRSVKEICRDNMIGKIAEAAVVTMAWQEYGIRIPVNYEVYPRGQYDDEDVNINGWSIDVKATRKGKWLLLEKNKINFRFMENNLPDLIMMCRVDWDEDTDAPRSKDVKLVGCVGIRKLLSPTKKDVLHLRAGEYIPGTKSRLQADNYAINFVDLCDIRTAMEYIVNNKRPGKDSAV
ncbi:MAG: hypothetical protein J6X83_00860 [Methanomicrobium sp.]|nr:hypothetical protein [Methanomicrobium sp.]